MREFVRLVTRHALAMGLLAATAVALPAHAQEPGGSHSGHSAKAHKAHSAAALPDVVSFSLTQVGDPATGKTRPRMEAPKGLASADELDQEIARRRAAEENDPAGQWINAAALGSLALGGALGANSLAGVLRRRKAAKTPLPGTAGALISEARSAVDSRVEPTFSQAQAQQDSQPVAVAAFARVGRPSKPRS